MKIKLITCEHCEGRGEHTRFLYGKNGMPKKAHFECKYCNGYGEMIALQEDMVVIKV
ncbi:MAG: hypothetical protein GY754_28400 [bacterium]|nr:hypothetical protein [bacterium]